MTDSDGRPLPADELPRRARQLLGVLTARHDRIQSKDALADAIWGDDLPGNHVAALEHYVSVVRRRLQPDRGASASFIVTRSGGYVVDTSRVGLDLADLRRLVRGLDAYPTTGPERLKLHQEILDLATDLPFPEDEYADWTSAARNDVRAATLAARLYLSEAACYDDPGRALRLAQEAIELDPNVEQSYRAAMNASMALGRPDEALRWYERCRLVLHDDLGVAPSAETTQLQRAVLRSRRPASEPAADDRPTGDRPAGGPPAHDRPTGRPPTVERPTGHGQARDTTTSERSTSERSTAGRWAAERSVPEGSARDDGAAADVGRGDPVEVSRAAGPLRLVGASAQGSVRRESPSAGASSAPAARGNAAAFVGRRTELDLMLDEFPVPLVHLVGPPGAGKSALLAELRRRAPGRVGIGHGAGSPGGLRLTWLRTAMVQLEAGADALAAIDAAIMEKRPLSLDELEVLALVLDRPEPVVVAVDDAAELDETSVTELTWMGRRCHLLSVVLAYRYPSVAAGRPIAALGTPVVLRLGPLTDEDVDELGGPDLPERTGGIPALVGAVHRAPEVATAMAMQIARSRTRWMPEAAWEVLRLSAALGSLRVADLAQLTGRPLPEVLDCVDQLIHAHLLTEGPGGHVRHRSGLIRLAVAEQVSSASRMHLHERLAACNE